MKAVVQRVSEAVLSVEGKDVSRIGRGLVCYLGVGRGDDAKDLDWLAKKTARLRIFPDTEGRMNLSAVDEGAAVLVVSQFTLYGDIRNGYRPGFSAAEEPAKAQAVYEAFMAKLREYGVPVVAGGVFGADMTIAQCNRGPVTILLDSRDGRSGA
ncbi:D-tyrosyl-tRNA(Tyr) deacylase [Candidatus Ozemobacteraceae bacterium]|nr:D-tyrosyl-tRNA(Tyr) deacylase [Candidatus Ozemobacteraceae bacterium]OQA07011.1 MAG: D-tyrosyl-tRNA(Tyr) deacylase [bacterium ADurb.Bin374]